MQMEMSSSFYYSTNEGRGAWVEAIEFLNKQEPLAAFQLHNGLSKAALDHAIDLANHNLMGTTIGLFRTYRIRWILHARPNYTLLSVYDRVHWGERGSGIRL